jgi:hypothetical protein
MHGRFKGNGMKKGIMLAVLAAVAGGTFAEEGDAAEQLNAMARKGIETFEWGLLIEAEGSYAKAGDEQESDLILATVQFTADAMMSEWLSAHVGLLWEEDDTEPMDMDEAYITLGTKFFVRAGKYYLPFGNFETAFISDPLTLELAEINSSSVMAGFANERCLFCAGAFKGDNDEVVENGYAAVSLFLGETAAFGVYWLSDILETDGFTDLNDDGLTQRESGAGAYASLFIGPVTVNAEYVSALSGIGIAGADYMPTAYNVEASVEFASRWTAGIKCEGSHDFYAEFDGVTLDGRWHEKGYGAVVTCAFHDNATIGIEYLRLQPPSGSENDINKVTAQLALNI